MSINTTVEVKATDPWGVDSVSISCCGLSGAWGALLDTLFLCEVPPPGASRAQKLKGDKGVQFFPSYHSI